MFFISCFVVFHFPSQHGLEAAIARNFLISHFSTLLRDRTDTAPVVTVVPTRVAVATVDVQAVRVVRIAFVRRRTPVEAAKARVAKRRTVAVTGSRQK